jgi:hypothetical protein
MGKARHEVSADEGPAFVHCPMSTDWCWRNWEFSQATLIEAELV